MSPDTDALPADWTGPLQDHEETVAALQYRRDVLYDELKHRRRERRETVTEMLSDLQDALGPDEEVPLVRMTEDYGRGGQWHYIEALTAAGVIATDITSSYGSRRKDATVDDLSRWPKDQTQRVADYLSGDRARPGYIADIADRITAIANDDDTALPRARLQYRG